MKKIAKFITSIMLCIVCACMIVACDEKKIASIELEDNTLRTKIYVGQELDTSKVVVTVTYEDKTTKKVKSAELEFSTIDTSKAGTEKLTITYKDFSIDVNITILAPGTSDTVAYFGSDLIDAFKDKGSAKADKNTEFTKLGITHRTGDDNALDLGIRTEGLDETDTRVDVDADIVFTFKIWDETANDWKELLTETEDTAVKYATYIEGITNTTVDFTEAAVGKKFEITAKLADGVKYDEDMISNTQLRLVTDVVDGYNVYNAQQLSLYDNANENGNWTAKKTEWGLMDVASPNALILQRDINITDADIPATSFWTEAELYDSNGALKSQFNHGGTTYAEKHAVGSMKDNQEYIYCRYVADDDKFDMYGNYFDINAQALTKAVYGSDDRESGGVKKNWYVDDAEGANSYICMHKTLFRVNGALKNSDGSYDNNEDDKDVRLHASQGQASMQDINFIGNGPRSADPKNSGGVILCKARSVNFTADNTISKDFNIIWFTEFGFNFTPVPTGADEETKTKLNTLNAYIANEGNDAFVQQQLAQLGVTNCKTKNAKFTYTNNKGYNSYNSHFYIWGGNAYMENNIMHDAGGPVIIADHVSHGYIKHEGDVTSSEKTMWAYGTPAYIDVVNCDYQSLVTGQEGWFATFTDPTAEVNPITALVQSFITPDTLFGSVGATKTNVVTKDGVKFLNMVLIYKWGDKGLPTGGGITRGYCRMFDDKTEYDKYYGLNGQTKDTTVTYGWDRSINWFENTALSASQSIPGKYNGNAAFTNLTNMIASGEQYRFENSSTGYNSIIPGTEDEAREHLDVYSGDYLNLYLSNGFGTMFEMYDRQ